MDMEAPKDRPGSRWYDDSGLMSKDSSGRMARPLTSKGSRGSTATSAETGIDRPTSRRGVKNFNSIGSSSNSNDDYLRAGSARVGSAFRPPSSFAARVPTAGVRIQTSNLGVDLRPMSGMQGPMNINVLDRPITQHGVSGVRPGTTRGLPMSRQVQDKRYYEGVLQLKIRDLSHEITSMMRDIESQNKDKINYLHYDKRAKDLAAELTALQGQLGDYNVVTNKMITDEDKDSIEREAQEMARVNDQALKEIEVAFQQRRHIEQQLHAIEAEIAMEQKTTEKIVESLDRNARDKYEELNEAKADLQREISMLQDESDRLTTEKNHLEEQVASSAIKQEAVKLHIKITELEDKRATLRMENKTKLTPAEEREDLLAKIKQQNTEISAAERQLMDLQKQTVKAEEELEQLENELEENQTDKQAKYKEYRKHEEAMEQFMVGFEDNRRDESAKLEKMEETVVTSLEIISSGTDSDVNFAVEDEKSILEAFSYDDESNFETLCQQYSRMKRTLAKMESMQDKYRVELEDLRRSIEKRQEDLASLDDIDGLKAKAEAKQESLKNDLKSLKTKEPDVKRTFEKAQREYEEIKGKLEKNDVYKQITALEDSLELLKQSNRSIKSFMEEQGDKANYGGLKSDTLQLVNKYNKFIKENTTAIY